MAKTVNLGEAYNHRVTLRLNDSQYNFIITIAEMLGVSPSDYLRMCINTAMVTNRSKLDMLLKGEVGTNENVKTDSDN